MRRRTAISAWAATIVAPRLAGAQAADALTVALVPIGTLEASETPLVESRIV